MKQTRERKRTSSAGVHPALDARAWHFKKKGSLCLPLFLFPKVRHARFKVWPAHSTRVRRPLPFRQERNNRWFFFGPGKSKKQTKECHPLPAPRQRSRVAEPRIPHRSLRQRHVGGKISLAQAKSFLAFLLLSSAENHSTAHTCSSTHKQTMPHRKKKKHKINGRKKKATMKTVFSRRRCSKARLACAESLMHSLVCCPCCHGPW